MIPPQADGGGVQSFQLHRPVTNRAVCKVIASRNAHFKAGDVIVCPDSVGTEDFSFLEEGPTSRAYRLDLHNPYSLEPKDFLSSLGEPGLTAFTSFYDIAEPRTGETIFVSRATSAIGLVVCQLAVYESLTVIGSVETDDEFGHAQQLGILAFNSTKERSLDALQRLIPNGNGIDIYFDNAGGEQLESAIDFMNKFGRIGMNFSY